MARILGRDADRESFRDAAKLGFTIRRGHRICRGLRILERHETYFLPARACLDANRLIYSDLTAESIHGKARRHDDGAPVNIGRRNSEPFDNTKAMEQTIVQPPHLQVVLLFGLKVLRCQKLSGKESYSHRHVSSCSRRTSSHFAIRATKLWD